MADTTCNGWTNYETWLAYTWLSNDEETWNHWDNEAERYAEDVRLGTPKHSAIDDLAGMLKAEHEDLIDSYNLRGFAQDIMQSAIDSIEWEEIASNLLSGKDLTPEPEEAEEEMEEVE